LQKGMKWLEKASDNNQSDAQALLGYCYYCMDDQNSTGYFYRKSAQNGNPMGQYLLGCAYAAGECGLETDYTTAAKLFASTGNSGVPAAQFAIGLYLYIGLGVDRNLEWSKQWMQIAAKNGNKNAIDFMQKMAFTEDASDEFIRSIIANSESKTEKVEKSNKKNSSTSEQAPQVNARGIEVGRSVMSDSHIWTLKSVERRDDCTICYWSAITRGEYTYIQGTADAYITVGSSSKKYYVQKCVGIPMEPDKKIVEGTGVEITYYTVFPAIPKKTKRISYYGSELVQIRNIDISEK